MKLYQLFLPNLTLITLTVPMKALRAAMGMMGRSQRHPQNGGEETVNDVHPCNEGDVAGEL